MAVFRFADERDYEAIHTFKKAIHKMHVDAEPQFYKSSESIFTKEFFLEEIAKEHIFALEDDGKLVGYLIWNEVEIKDHPLIIDRKIMMIDDLFIDNSRRNKGYGREMMDRIEEYAKGKGFASIELTVWDFNEGAQKFYRSIGMRAARIRMEKIIH